MVVIDMDMPECCGDCPFCITNGMDRTFCMNIVDSFQFGNSVENYKYGGRPEYCPLMEAENETRN